MAADAFTPIHFYAVFKEDLLAKTEAISSGAFGTELYELYSKLGFILAKRAEHADMAAITPEDFEEWLAKFEFVDMTDAVIDIADLYAFSKKGTVNPKA